jgi:hypothetical protein
MGFSDQLIWRRTLTDEEVQAVTDYMLGKGYKPDCVNEVENGDLLPDVIAPISHENHEELRDLQAELLADIETSQEDTDD